jgi:Flagellar transcriptional activator (FlhC)
MRISEDRYDRDRQRLELALRFLTHEARTQTIRHWTGLSDDRIRKLYRSYLGRAACYVPRHRGKSPHQAAYFTRSLRIQQETAVLASFFALNGLVPADPSPAAAAALPDIPRGNSLCAAFESYATLVPTASISFEYAVFLAECLARGDQLRLGRCCECGGMIVVERFPIRDKRCQHCTGGRGETATNRK